MSLSVIMTIHFVVEYNSVEINHQLRWPDPCLPQYEGALRREEWDG